MGPSMEVLLDIRHGAERVDGAFVAGLARFAMEQLGLPSKAEVSVTFVDDGEMGDLNFRYRGIEGPTDVLSFECDNLDDDFPDLAGGVEADDVYSLGDVVIAPDVAARQAQEYGNSFQDELALLLVHGILHLDGYDHIDDADARRMEAKQAQILSQWKASSAGVGTAESGCGA